MEQPSTVEATTSTDERGRNRRRIKQGRVSSNKMDKTIVVVAETRVPHPVYKKVVRQSRRFKAHDELNTPASATSSASKSAVPTAKRSAGACSRFWSARSDSTRDATQGRRQLRRA